ncbi:MAG: hypothetical protein WC121_14195 [Candidatus Kapaibacterium sp.]
MWIKSLNILALLLNENTNPIGQLIDNFLENTLGWMIKHLGIQNVTIIIIAFFILITILYWLKNRGKKNSYDLLIAEKDTALQRIAQENRECKIMLFHKTLKIPLEDAERLISKNQYTSPDEARKDLEKGN